MDAALGDTSPQVAEMHDMCSSSIEHGVMLRDLLEHLSDKWTLLVVGMLESGAVRYSEIKNRVPGISQRMLTLTLKKLERDGLVSRQSFAEVPPRVEYSLTALGRTLLPPALAFARWAMENVESIMAERAAYDSRD